MSLAVVKGSGLGKGPKLGQLSNTTVIPWNTLRALSNLWLKDLNMKRDWEHWHMTTHCFRRAVRKNRRWHISKGRNMCPHHTHTHTLLHSTQQCFLLLLLPLPSKCAVFHMEEVAKMKVFPFFPHKTSFWLELASCSYPTWLNQSFSPPTLAPSAARLSSRARCQQSRLLWEEKVLSLEFQPYTLQGASLWSLERRQRATSSLPRCLPLLISKEGSWGREQKKDKTSMCTLKFATLIFI